MTWSKKTYGKICGGVIGTLLLLQVLIGVSELILNREPVKKKIHTLVSRKIKGDIRYTHIDLSLWFTPRIIIHEPFAALSDNMTGTATSLTIHPSLLNMLFKDTWRWHGMVACR